MNQLPIPVVKFSAQPFARWTYCFPGIGEIIGGSQREDSFDKLTARMHEVGIDPEALWWYLDTRRFGSAPHAGFGLGFERLVLFCNGHGQHPRCNPIPPRPKNRRILTYM